MEINNFHFILIILYYFMIIIYNTTELTSNHQIQDHRLFQQRNLHQNFQNHDSFSFLFFIILIHLLWKVLSLWRETNTNLFAASL